MAQSCPLRCMEECPLGVIGWQSPPDPTDKLTGDKDQGVAPARALELMSGSGMHESPPAKQGMCLKIC